MKQKNRKTRKVGKKNPEKIQAHLVKSRQTLLENSGKFHRKPQN